MAQHQEQVLTNKKLKEKLLEFFQVQTNVDILFGVLEKKIGYSLRILEWFVTNYCKRNLVEYKVNGQIFNVYKKYKDYLKSYTKEKFDPFKRTKNGSSVSTKFNIKNNKTGEVLETSICQLNFFKWLISNNIHKYVEKNLENIKLDMNNYKEEKQNKKNNVNKNIVKKETKKVSIKLTKKFD